MPPLAKRALVWVAVIVALLLIFKTDLLPAAEPLVQLRGEFIQGGLVRGKTTVDSTVELDGRKLRLSEDGQFTFGFGRDRSGVSTLKVTAEDGRTETIERAITAREFALTEVNGVAEDKLKPNTDNLGRIAAEQKLINAARAKHLTTAGFGVDFIWPVEGRVSGHFGSRRVFNGWKKSTHYGLDIAAAEGTPVRAPAPGIVVLTHEDMYYTGGTVIIEHGHRVSSTLIHLSKIDVKERQYIKQGDIIGEVGMTGRATGPHLHWGMNWEGERLDPELLLPTTASEQE